MKGDGPLTRWSGCMSAGEVHKGLLPSLILIMVFMNWFGPVPPSFYPTGGLSPVVAGQILQPDVLLPGRIDPVFAADWISSLSGNPGSIYNAPEGVPVSPQRCEEETPGYFSHLPVMEQICKDLKEKKEVVEEKAEKKVENGSGDAPTNGTEENGTDHSEEKKENTKDPEKEDEVEGDGEAEGDEEEGEGEKTETDAHPVKRPAEEEKETETKKQKTENGDSTEVKESA